MAASATLNQRRRSYGLAGWWLAGEPWRSRPTPRTSGGLPWVIRPRSFRRMSTNESGKSQSRWTFPAPCLAWNGRTQDRRSCRSLPVGIRKRWVVTGMIASSVTRRAILEAPETQYRAFRQPPGVPRPSPDQSSLESSRSDGYAARVTNDKWETRLGNRRAAGVLRLVSLIVSRE